MIADEYEIVEHVMNKNTREIFSPWNIITIYFAGNTIKPARLIISKIKKDYILKIK